ncbi:MAG: hypothetical protein ACXWC4_25985 [Telluria sp.]
MSERHGEKKEVDDDRETLHNLASLLLTNTTIRTMQQGSTVCLFFKKSTVDKCGRLMKVPVTSVADYLNYQMFTKKKYVAQQ